MNVVMTVQKKFHRHSLNFLALNLLSGIPFLAALAFILIRGFKLIWDTWSWIAFGICIVNLILGFYWQNRREKKMKCPECKQMLFLDNFKDLKPSEQIFFHCKSCDIQWDTGLRCPQDSEVDGGIGDIDI